MDLKYKAILFDFDGTVLNTGPGILKCATETIREFGFELPEEHIMHRFIGPPLKRSFMDTFGAEADMADKLVDSYRTRYKQNKGMFDALPYPGMEELLIELNEAGATVAIASAKQERIVRDTLVHFDLMKYFKAVAGAVPNCEFADKVEIMTDCLTRLNASREDSIMVGDTRYDAEASGELNVDFCAAMWGYGFKSIDDLKQYRCRYIAQDVPALRHFLLD